MTTRTHEWRSYAANHFECGVCGGIADNANGTWKFGAGVQPRECPGPKLATEARSWGKPAAQHAASRQSWPTAAASDVQPPKPAVSWPPKAATPEQRAVAWPTAKKKTAWPTAAQ